MAKEVISVTNNGKVMLPFLTRLNAAVKEQHYTNRGFAEAVGVSAVAVNHWLNGRTVPDSRNLLSICMVLGVTPNDLLLGPECESDNECNKE